MTVNLWPVSRTLVVASLFGLVATPAAAEGPSAEELARKAQDPLADVKALMTDNTISFGTSDDETAYNFQLQPVYSLPTGERPYNLILRGVVPIIGAPVGAGLPGLDPEPIPDKGQKWGVSDIMLQMFWAPKSDADFKWGIGPQVSLRTRTSERVAGPGWGAGVSGVAFGTAGRIAYGALVNHHWGQDDFNVSTIQPMVFYNLQEWPGGYVSYNNSITYNWEADSGEHWQVPVGLTVGRTFPLGTKGDALDLNLGAYKLVTKPTGGADWQLKFGISWYLP